MWGALTWSDSHSRMQVLIASTQRLGFRSLGHRPAWEYTTFAADIIGIAVTRQFACRRTVQQCPRTNQIQRGNSIHHILTEAGGGRGNQKCWSSDEFNKSATLIKVYKLPEMSLINLKNHSDVSYHVASVPDWVPNCRVFRFRFSCCSTLCRKGSVWGRRCCANPPQASATWVTVACLLTQQTPAALQSWST